MSYRRRLVIEGWTLAACGALGSLVLLVAVEGSTDGPASTIGQLAVVAALLGFFGPRAVHGSFATAVQLAPGDRPAGEPTPLWHIAAVVALLCVPFAVFGAPDSMLRVTGGCLLVGLAQAVLLAGLVGRIEARRGAVAYRMPGSRLGRGTKLGLMPRPSAPDR